jgi:transcription initiation factor TFIIA large subunit
MSNQTVGAVYAQIIADVIDSSRVDFEEMGVEESVLEDLKKVSSPAVWETALSSNQLLPSGMSHPLSVCSSKKRIFARVAFATNPWLCR